MPSEKTHNEIDNQAEISPIESIREIIRLHLENERVGNHPSTTAINGSFVGIELRKNAGQRFLLIRVRRSML